VEARSFAGDDDSTGLVLRYQNNNYYEFSADEQHAQARIRLITAGVVTELSSVPLQGFHWAAPGHVLRFNATGDHLTGAIDGQVVVAANDATYTSGRIGFFNGDQSSTQYDDLAIYSTTRAPNCGTDAALSAEFAWYPATGTTPQELVDEHWASLARYSPSAVPLTFGEDSHPIAQYPFEAIQTTGTNLAAFIDETLFAARDLIDTFQAHPQGFPTSTSFVDGMATPLLRVLTQGKDDRPGRVLLHELTGPTKLVNVYGYSTGDAMRLVDEDNLSCAVKGNIEGQICTLSFKYASPVAMATADLADFTQGVSFTINDAPGQKLYLVKPFNPTDLRPGRFEALAGFEEPATGTNHFVPITPRLSELAAEALKPSREWCTYPAVGCDGTIFGDKVTFDARVPLENELTQDNDGVESSWRRSLQLARSAADEANALGEAYMRSGIELDQLDQSEQLRQAQDRIRFQSRADSEGEVIQNICGTDVETSTFLDMLGVNRIPLSAALQCRTDADCGQPNAQTAVECVAGRCVQGLVPVLDDAGDAETYQRLHSCIGEDSVVDVATIGNTPVCLWDTNQGFCVGDKNGSCPSLAKQTDAGYTCVGTLAERWMQKVPANLAPVIVGPVTTTVGITDNSSQVDVTSPCESIRTLRESAYGPRIGDDSIIRNYLQNLDQSGLFDRETLRRTGSALTWEARFGNHSAVLVDGQPVFETGQLGAVNTANWPCHTAQLPPTQCSTNPLLSSCSIDCSKTPRSLLCQQADCTNWDARTPMNVRLMNAVWAAQALTVANGDDDQNYGKKFTPMVVPTRYTWANHTLGTPNPFSPSSVMPGYLKDGSGTIKRYATSFGGNGLTTTSTAAADLDFWADLANPGQRLRLTADIQPVMYALEPIIPVGTAVKTPNNGEHASLSLATYYDPLNIWHGVSRYDEVSGHPSPFPGMHTLFSGWSAGMSPLVQTDPRTWMADFYAAPNGNAAAFNQQYGGGINPVADRYSQIQQLVPIMNYTDDKLFDAAELLCEVSRKSEKWVNSLDIDGACPAAPLTYESQDDIPKVRNNLMCQAEVIRRRANNIVLRRLPKLAVKDLLSFNGSRVFPEIGGEMGEAVGKLRESLLRFRNGGMDLASQVAQMQYNLDRLYYTLKQVQVRKTQDNDSVGVAGEQGTLASLKMQQLEFEADNADWNNTLTVVNSVMSGMATGAAAGGGGAVVGGAIWLANAENQIDDATQKAAYQRRVADVEQRIAGLMLDSARQQVVYDELERAKTLAELEYEVHRAMIGMQITVNNMRADLEGLDVQLRSIEGLAFKVKRSISRLTSFETSDAAITPQLRGVLLSRFDVGKQRYEAAHARAVKYAFLAKRAIEQRLGMRLAEMREDLPLVDAPQKWESSLCRSTGIDYAALKNTDGTQSTVAQIADKADPFIGAYVDKLQDVVESYTMKFGFKDGTDEAVISVRDDIDNVRQECPVESQNLLYYSGQVEPVTTELADGSSAGWTVIGCTPDQNGSVAACLASTPAEPFMLDGVDGQSKAYELTFGNGATGARLSQNVHLGAGTYLLSWYANTPGTPADNPGPQAVHVYNSQGAEVSYLYSLQRQPLSGAGTADWRRQYIAFAASSVGDYQIGVPKPATGNSVKLAAIALTDASASIVGADDPADVAPPPFQLTKGSRELSQPVCKDAGGVMFRQTRWDRQCSKLCETGFGANCPDAPQECFWQTEFSITQGDIERGLMFKQAGFARGNFNYRVEGIGLNFVGTGLHACGDQQTPEPCYSAGFVPYTLYHLGPYLVTNHTGRPFKADLFEGLIEHARGLGAERYLTNPLSSSDRELLTPYIRGEFQGRPLDGTYRLRVWDAPGLQFSAIEDVQLYLKYRYWTRTN